MRAIVKARPSSAAISRAIPATSSTPESVPEVPQLVTTTGMPADRLATSNIRRSLLSEPFDDFEVPEPR